MSTLSALEPAEYAVIGASGLTTLLALAACTYTVPWRCCPCGSSGAVTGGSPAKPAPTRSFNVLWHGRAALCLLSAAWALSLLLRLSSLWGANSLMLPQGTRAWTGAGWMCRVYLTASLGVLHPLCACATLLMLTAALSRGHRPETLRHPNARLLGRALLCTLPVAAAQAIIAWLGLAVQYQGDPVEAHPRSVLGYFFATYWTGTPQQCSASGSDSTAAAGGAAPSDAGGCTLCVFPAAAAIAHAVFAAAFVAALCVTSSRLAAAVLNQRLKRRMRAFQAAYSALTLLGAAAVGASIAWGPFTWANQACWLVLAACSLLTALLVVWEVVVWPVRDLRAADKRLVLWADAFAAAAADEAFDTRSSGSTSLGGFGSSSGGSSLIKAHAGWAQGAAVVQAAAVARTLSASTASQHAKQQQQPKQQSKQQQETKKSTLPFPALPSGHGNAGMPPLPFGWSPRRTSTMLHAAPVLPPEMPPVPPPQQQQQHQQHQAAVYTTPATASNFTARELLFP